MLTFCVIADFRPVYSWVKISVGFSNGVSIPRAFFPPEENYAREAQNILGETNYFGWK